MGDQRRMQNSKENYNELCDAFVNKNRKKIKDLINDNVPIDWPNSRENTPLHWTIIQFNDIDIMVILLNNGADIYARNHNNETPLYVAVQNGRIEAAKLLLQKGALDNDNLNSLLLAAIDKHHVNMVKLLIEYDKKRNALMNLVMPPQQYIPRDVVLKFNSKAEACLDLLLNNNFTIHPDCYHDADFIYKAVENNHLLIVLQLLEHGIDVNMINSSTGFNLLTIACLKKRYKVIEVLLEHHADVNMPIPDEKLKNMMPFSCNLELYRQLLKSYDQESESIDVTCLHVAVFSSDPVMTKLLIKFGAKITNDPTYSTLVRIAIYNRCEEIILIFLEHGVSPDNLDPKGNSLVHFCIYYDPSRKDHYENIIKLLLKRGANIQTPGNDLVLGTIINNNHKILQLLLNNNADIQYRSPDGDSLLHVAIKRKNDITMIEQLLKYGIPINATDNEGITPLTYVCQSTFSRDTIIIIKLLLKYGADVNCVDKYLKTPLHYVCQFQYQTDRRATFLISQDIIKTIELLLENGANVNCVDNFSMTPLFYASLQQEKLVKTRDRRNFNDDIMVIVNMIKVLLKYRADVNAVDDRGWTPFLIASNSDNDEVIKCFLNHHISFDKNTEPKQLPIYIEWQCQNNFIQDLFRSTNVSQYITIMFQLIRNLPSTYINLNSIDKNGNTFLHYAVIKNDETLVRDLIKHGADINICNKKNLTPLQVSCSPTRRRSDNIANMLVLHQIKLKAAGLNVIRQNSLLIGRDIQLLRSDIMENFYKEINTIACETINIDNGNVTRYITLHNLLTKSIHFLSKFVNVEDVEEILKSTKYDVKFPSYVHIIRNRFREAKVRRTLLNIARVYFKEAIRHILPDVCIDEVLSNMDNEDLEKIIIAYKPSNAMQSSLLIKVISNNREMLIFHY